MQHLVCWTLMGLRTISGREVWYQLGTFGSESSAAEAAASNYWTGQGFHKVSVVPYYRVDQSVTTTRSSETAEAAGRVARTAAARVAHTAV